MIPEEKRAAVTRALEQTFGVTEYEEISFITKGNPTTVVARIIVRGSPYVLKMIMRTDDATRHFASMRSAATAGLAPPVRYANVEDRLCIADFVVHERLSAAEGLARMAGLLRELHALPPFGRVPDWLNTTCTYLMNEGPAVGEYLAKFQAANLVPEGERAEVFARFDQLAAAYRCDPADMVSCHNDLFKPDNILFDGDRLCLCDWETAFLNDRYVELAVVANMLVANDDHETAFLTAYFGEPPNDYQRARLYLMQQLAHMFYATAFLLFGSAGKPTDWSEPALEFSELQRIFWNGDLTLKDNQSKTIYGKAHWKQLLTNLRRERFERALDVIQN